jgi:phosphoesterase RecJ-like protein
MSSKKALALIKKSKVFLISTHLHPEADGIGAELAFLSLLKKIGKQGYIVNESRVPDECKFLPGIEQIQPLTKEIREFDCAVFLDCADMSRAGKVAALNKRKAPTLNIDHHISNTRFAEVNWVDTNSCSTSEMVYRLYQKLKAHIDEEAALTLYAGIVVDTGSFRYSNTNSRCHRVAASLIDRGIRPHTVYRSLFENNSLSDIQALGRVLLTIKRSAKGRIVWADIRRNAIGQMYPAVDLAEITLGLLRSIKDVELAIVFKEIGEERGRIRINFRSQTNFDCNYLANCFGGGGHINASGTTISGDFFAIKQKVIARAEELMKVWSSTFSQKSNEHQRMKAIQ